MGFRFRRSIRILPGLRVNLGKRGASLSVGVRGAHVTVGPTGTRTTVGLPGTGLSYTHLDKPTPPQQAEPAPAPDDAPLGPTVTRLLLWLLGLSAIAFAVWSTFRQR